MTASPCEPPPLAREEREFLRRSVRAGRTTPAGAGRTPRCSCTPPAASNHPRWRGKNVKATLKDVYTNEPPPLAREELAAQFRQVVEDRTTPAGAGRTSAALTPDKTLSNHPRWRGKNHTLQRLEPVVIEPPPLAREEHPRCGLGIRRLRTTPAGAGRTQRAGGGTASAENHPRWRGKNHRPPSFTSGRIEPPPLAREERPDECELPPEHRTTPAGAGRTCPVNGSVRRPPNHPRWRGKNSRVGGR